MYGPISATKARQIEEFEDSAVHTAALHTALELCVDAKSVYSAIEAKDTKVPSESSLLSSVQCGRELLDNKRLRALHWIDTRDMIADGLTKGSIDRKALHMVIEKNTWNRIGDPACTLSAFIAGSYNDIASHLRTPKGQDIIGWISLIGTQCCGFVIDEACNLLYRY